MKKKVISLVLATVMCVGMLSGCGSSTESTTTTETATTESATTEESAATETASGETVSLMFVSPTNGNEIIQSVQQQLVADYNAQADGVEVTLEFIPNEDRRTYYATQFTAGNGPDIYTALDTEMSSDYASGWIADLSAYYDVESNYESDGITWRDTLADSVYERLVQTDGAVPGYATSADTVRIFFNVEIMEEVGVEVPETWDEFMDVCQQIKDAGITPFGFPNSSTDDSSWLWFNNSMTNQVWPDLIAEIDTDGSTYITNDEMLNAIETGAVDFAAENTIGTWELLKEFSQYWTSDYNSLDKATALEMFARGEVAMCQAHTAELSMIETLIDGTFEYGVMPVPVVMEENVAGALEKSVVLGGQPDNVYMVNKDLEGDEVKMAAAIDFIQFMGSSSSQWTLLEECYRIPLNTQITELPDSLQGFVVTEEPLRTQVYGWDENIRNTLHRGGQMFLTDSITGEAFGEMLNQAYDDFLLSSQATE